MTKNLASRISSKHVHVKILMWNNAEHFFPCKLFDFKSDAENGFFFVLNHARDRGRKSNWPRADRQYNFKIIFHVFFFCACETQTTRMQVWDFRGYCIYGEKQMFAILRCDDMWNKLKILDLRSRKGAKLANEGYDVREKRTICCINKVCINKALY